MSDLVDRLSRSDQAVELSLRPNRDLATLKERLDMGYIHVLFPNTRGGTELGVRIDTNASDVSGADMELGAGKIVLVGSLVLDFTPVTCRAEIDISSFTGIGRLEPAAP